MTVTTEMFDASDYDFLSFGPSSLFLRLLYNYSYTLIVSLLSDVNEHLSLVMEVRVPTKIACPSDEGLYFFGFSSNQDIR